MKTSSFLRAFFASCVALAACNASATTWYVNDGSTEKDVYCSAAGNAANDGSTSNAPALSVSQLTNVQPGDTVFIDTGLYGQLTFSKSGTAAAPIVLQGSPNGTLFHANTSGGNGVVRLNGNFLHFNTAIVSNSYSSANVGRGLVINGSKCSFSNLFVFANVERGIDLSGQGHAIENCVVSGFRGYGIVTVGGNTVSRCTLTSPDGHGIYAGYGSVPSLDHCVVSVGGCVFGSGVSCSALVASNCLFYGKSGFKQDLSFRSVTEAEGVCPNLIDNISAPAMISFTDEFCHLPSPAGHVVKTQDASGTLTRTWVTNSTVSLSLAVDAGDVSADVDAEPAPNGSRLDIGAYAGTAEASKSPITPSLAVVSFDGGGNLIGSGKLRWLARNISGNVRIDYSTDDWASYTSLATVAATNESCTFTATETTVSPIARWRVVAVGDSTIAATSSVPFSVRLSETNGFTYYINDGDPTGDVYCTAVGNDENTGVSSNAPKATLQNLLDTYSIRGGDTVYIDSGAYNLATQITLQYSVRGEADNLLCFKGASPSLTVFDRGGGEDAFHLWYTAFLSIENMSVSNALHTFRIESSHSNVIRQCEFHPYRSTAARGILANGSRGNLVENCLISGHGTGYGVIAANFTFVNDVFAGNDIHVWGADTFATNNIFTGGGTAFNNINNTCDYNLFDTNVTLCSVSGYATLSALSALGKGWSNSLVVDPCFVDAANGDYHLLSTNGYWSATVGAWVTNGTVHSLAIDTGAPDMGAGEEPPPNGGRINIGLYGGTSHASKSATGPWLQVISPTGGDTFDATASGTVRWTGGNFSSGDKVSIYLSRDNKTSWELVASGLDAAGGVWEYAAGDWPEGSEREAFWQIVLESDPAVESSNDTPFAYKYGVWPYYVNDGSRDGDVYCTAVGNDENNGLSRSAPKASLAALLSVYTLTPGDIVYVDTGIYPASPSSTAYATLANIAGEEGKSVKIIGSTDTRAGGSVVGERLVVTNSSFIDISSLTFTNAIGVDLYGASSVSVHDVFFRSNATYGVRVQQCNGVDIAHVSALAPGGLLYEAISTNVTLSHASVHGAAKAAVVLENKGALSVSSSAFSVFANGASVFSVAAGTTFESDWNGVHSDINAFVGTYCGVAYESLAAWTAGTGLDAHSLGGEPLFADPENGDFHLCTTRTRGRFLPDGTRTADTVRSPLLAAGDPDEDASAQAEPSRVNIGRYGGTAEASLPPAAPWLQAATFLDAGGVSAAGDVALRWISGGGASGGAVVSVSKDGGFTWEAVATVADVSTGEAVWTVSASDADSPACRWRVALASDGTVSSATEKFFALRKAPLVLYLNNFDTNDTVFTTAAGAATNYRATAEAPLDSLARAFALYDLEGGDTLKLDRGVYTESADIVLTRKNTGTAASNPVVVSGLPTDRFSGAVLARASRTRGYDGVTLSAAGPVRFENLAFSNNWNGIVADTCSNFVCSFVRFSHSAANGILANAGSSVVLSNSFIASSGHGLFVTGGVVRAENCLFRSNTTAAVFVNRPLYGASGSLAVHNSILSGGGSSVAYAIGSSNAVSLLDSDCNDVFMQKGTPVGRMGTTSYRYLYDWQQATGLDAHTVGFDPLFADEEAGDFHLRSEFGHYHAGDWIEDGETSALIDLADSDSGCGLEPQPNGGRRNIGLYGGSEEASKSAGAVVTNITPLTMSDGGVARGSVTLYWDYNGFNGNEYCFIEASCDGGDTWTTIETNRYVNGNGYVWDVSALASTAQALWRISVLSGGSVVASGTTETVFSIKNEPLVYYVNDASTNADVYCSAPGNAANDGLSAETPLDSIETVFKNYQIDAGDTVYVDTGTYVLSDTFAINQGDVSATNYLSLKGSTNFAAGGSVLTNAISSNTVVDVSGSLVDFRNFTLLGGPCGFHLTSATSNRIASVTSIGASRVAFEIGKNSGFNEFVNCAALDFGYTGLVQNAASAETDTVQTNTWIGGVFANVERERANYPVSHVGVGDGLLRVTNSVFVARAAPNVCFFNAPAGSLASDYNCFHRNGFPLAAMPIPGAAYGVRTRYAGNLEDWRTLSANDRNSFEADPLFTDLGSYNLLPRTNSPLIDTGDPSLATWRNEPTPNGGRVNLGVFGGTPFAQTTPVDFGYTVLLSYADGGTASGSVPLRWTSVGVASNADYTLRAEVSSDDGLTWLDQGTASGPSGEVTWDSTVLESSPCWQWRVNSQRADIIPVTTSGEFVLHNNPIHYFVNDTSTNGDVYCSRTGASAYDGLSPDTPLDSVATVLSRYDLGPGDIIHVDTGIYENSSVVSISPFDGGTVDSPVRVSGSTNSAAGGTIFTGCGLSATSLEGFALSDVVFASHAALKTGFLQFHDSQGISLDRVDVQGSLGDGIIFDVASNVYLRNVSISRATSNGVVAAATTDAHILRSTIWSNALGAVDLKRSQLGGDSPSHSNSTLSVHSSVLGSFGTRVPVFRIADVHLSSDYNAISAADGALVALVSASPLDLEYDSLVRWNAATSNDVHTLTQDPLFWSPRDYDFHLRSAGGRWSRTGIVRDAETSPLVDAGDPDDGTYANELPANGGRVNIGRYAGTSEGSATPAGSRLTLISLNDGGSISGTNTICWLASGPAAEQPVTLSYSEDGGDTWVDIAEVPAGTTEYTWDVSGIQSVATLLRLEAADGTTVQSETTFAIRSRPYAFYVNDDSRAGDVYCSAVGSVTNTGLSTNSPLRDLNDLLARYDLEAGDVVYIDTGVYMNAAKEPWIISQQDSAYGAWERDGDVVFQGSTNRAAGGTVIDAGGGETALRLEYVQGVALRHLILSHANSTNAALAAALSASNALHCTFEWLEARDSVYGYGFYGCSNLWLNHSVARGVDVGAYVNSYNASISNCVFWMPDVGPALSVDGRYAVSLSGSVLSATNDAYVFSVSEQARLDSDYNAFFLADGARVCRVTHASTNSPVPTLYETVGQWTSATNNDVHSYSGTHPGFADAAGGDFHLLSTAGRWNGTSWTNDAASSPLIDLGNPASDASEEPLPNGGRCDIGLYGGTPEASKTPADSGFTLLSFNRGGVASNRIAFAWIPLGSVASHTVKVEFSSDNGGTWETLAQGIAATEGELVWNSGTFASPLCYWRVTDESDSSVSATNALPFTLHNRPISYYVNDDDPSDDVWCSAVGSIGADGLSPATPVLNLQTVVDTYDLEPGDTVYVDTGYYYLERPIEIGDLDCGTISTSIASQVTIQGSTDMVGEGTFFWHSDTNATSFSIAENAVGLRFRNLNFSLGSAAILARSAYFLDFDWLDVDGVIDGLSFTGGSDIHVTHSLFRNCSRAGIFFDSRRDSQLQTHATLDVASSVFWNNRFGVYLAQGYLTLVNSVMGLLADNQIGYLRRSDGAGSGFVGDYNDFYVATNTAYAAALQSGQEDRINTRTNTYASVSRLQEFFSSDIHSLSHDPLFADPEQGDFHLQSTAGRWEKGVWVYDDGNSPLIDSADPSDISWAVEPSPNGRRLNIGRYGGTPHASRSAVAGTLVVSSLNDGGSVSGEVLLSWVARGEITNSAVVIDYSPDNGLTWREIVSGIPATDGTYMWNSAPFGSSALSLWRIHGERPYEHISATSESPFTLRNAGTIRYYVNDTHDEGRDVYCTAPGDDRNDGLTPATPKASLEAVLETYDLDPEDVVLVDSGTYPVGSPAIEITQADAGYANAAGEKFFVTLQGSTNPVAPTILAARAARSPVLFNLSYVDCFRFRDLVLSNGLVAVSGDYADNIEFERVRFETPFNCALSLNYAKDWTMGNCIIRLPVTNAVSLGNSSIGIDSSVLWCAADVFALGAGASLSVSNSVLRASGASSRVYPVPFNLTATNAIRSDYNDYVRDNSSILLEQTRMSGGSVIYDSVGTWYAASGQDAHSMVLDPLFADSAAGDFHLQSSAGRFLIATNAETGLPETIWTNDVSVRSPLIDAASPATAWSAEPTPNGGIRNIGAYGNTPQASKSLETPWIQAVSCNSGESIAGTVLLYWTYGGTNDNTQVEIAYSEDGSLWHEPMAVLPISAREYVWDTSAIRMLPHVKWRVRTIDQVLEDVSDAFCSIRNATSTFFVNDGVTNGDVWCVTVGAEFGSTNALGVLVTGTNAACPLRSVQEILDNYPVGAGDKVYVDTGLYTTPVTFTIDNAGRSGNPLVVRGSTNGTHFVVESDTQNAFEFINTSCIEVSDISVSGGRNAWYLENASDIALSRVVASSAASNGVLALNAADFSLRNALVVSNRAAGYRTGNNLSGTRLIDFATFAANGEGIFNAGAGTLTVSNSVLVATNGVLYTYPAQNASIVGDYNLYALADSAALAYDSSSRATYIDLSQWAAKAGEGHSVVLDDPLFADAANGDYHLASRAGSWHDGTWARDAGTSWGVDFANPEILFANNRANAGAYGGTERESKSDSATPVLQVLTFADGGTASNGVTLRWNYRGISPSSQVRISYYNGSEWIPLGAPCRADADGYYWHSSDDPSPESFWKVELVSNPDVCSVSEMFSYRPKPISYYVNDSSPADDVYCSEAGAATNLGFRTNSPLDSVQAVLDRFTLVGGDVIYVDTGEYALEEPIEWTSVDSGDTGNGTVVLAGSTNAAAGGTVFREAAGRRVSSAFIFPYATHDVCLKQFTCEGFDSAVASGQSCQSLAFEDLSFLSPRGEAIANGQGNDFTISRVIVSHAGTNGVSLANASRTTLSNCVFHLVASNAIAISQSPQTAVTNCIFVASGEGAACYRMDTADDLVASDYNDLYLLDNAVVAVLSGIQYESVPQWVKYTARDLHSLCADPLFAAPESGDFHLKSVAGRRDPRTGGWMNDAVHSPCIDTGVANASDATNEPSPNGGRINMGAFGGTAQASKSDMEDWVQAVSAMGGGLMSGTITLVWNYGGRYLDPAGVATLDYSPDNGQTWTLIATTTLSNGLYRWVSTQTSGGSAKWPSSPGAMWRITSGGASDRTAYFGLRNEPFKYYVNDDSTDADIWCTAIGDDGNLGYWASAPKRTLENLLASIDAEPGDGIYIDTGTYPMATNIIWNASDGGENGSFVHARGSTNGVCFISAVTNRTFLVEANYTDIANIDFDCIPETRTINVSFTGTGLSVSNFGLRNSSLSVGGNEGIYENFRFDRRNATLAGTNNLWRGLHLASGTVEIAGNGNTLANSIVHTSGSSATGILVRASSAVVSNCTVESERGSAVAFLNPAGSYRLLGSILVAGGTNDEDAVVVWEDGALDSDWNDLVARNGTWVGIHDGDKWERLAYWQAATGADAHSIALEPLFVNDGEDFHLDSTTGFWNELSGGWVPGMADSPCIDAGNPATPYSRETLPNGSRIDLGAYGNTPQASLSARTNYVVAVSPADGGAVTGAVELVWAAPYGHGGTVSLYYRDGTDWVEIALGLPAGDGRYVWDTEGLNLFATRWKVVDSEGNESESESAFDIRNAPQAFYVNDGNVNVPGYCSAAGNDANDGLTPATPKATLAALLAAYDLEPGDTVYVDAGNYRLSGTTRLVWSSGGNETDPVSIVGYPTERSTWFRRASGVASNVSITALDLKPDYVVVSNFAFGGVNRAVLCDRTVGTDLGYLFVSNVATGVEALSAEDVTVSHSGFINNSRSVAFSNTVDAAIVNNTFVARDVAPAGVSIDLRDTTDQGLTVKNNIFQHVGYSYAYGIHDQLDQLSGGMAFVDYNLYDFIPVGDSATNTVVPGFFHGAAARYPTLMDWQLAVSNDFRSATNAAELVETEALYSLDFHPKSIHGRWKNGSFVKEDDTTSFAVDHGDIYQDVGDEPEQNSDRINIGMYGGTVQASKGSGDAYYETRSLSEEGGTIPLVMGDTYVLVWSSEGFDSNKLVNVEYFNGTKWVTLATGIPAWQEYILFTPDQTYMTANGRWRVSSADNPAESATSEGDISMRFGELRILTAPKLVNGRIRFNWQGGIGGKKYWILYSDDGGQTWHKWSDSENGPAFLNRNHFTLTTTQESYIFEDRTSYRSPHRLYAIVETGIGEDISAETRAKLHIPDDE